MPDSRPIAMAILAIALLATAACGSQSTSSGPAPAGANHTAHLRGGGAFGSTPPTCDGCHAASGFKVDFSQNPTLMAAGARFDPATKTCSNVYCHGSFTLGTVTGASTSPAWYDSGATGCGSCHALPPTGHPVTTGNTPATCSGCHPTSISSTGAVIPGGTHLNGLADMAGLGCVSCHGDGTRIGTLAGTDVNLHSAPPKATDTARPGVVGAHLGHVNPSTSSVLMPPIGCAECHPVPTDFQHAKTPPPQSLVFGPLSRMGGASPTYTAATMGCATTYCHGAFTFGAVKGTSAAPLWGDAWPTTEARCTNCHGMPPTGHPTYTGTPTAASCFQCHPEALTSTGAIKVGGSHLNGKAEGGGACGSCHALPPATGRHSKHRSERCDGCHPTGYTSSTTVAPFHGNGTTDMGSQAGYSCGLVECPVGQTGTCTVNCHGENHKGERW